MFAKAEILQFFPSCVWAHQLTDAEALNERLTAECYRLRETDTRGIGYPAGTWQSQTDLHMQ